MSKLSITSTVYSKERYVSREAIIVHHLLNTLKCLVSFAAFVDLTKYTIKWRGAINYTRCCGKL